jgi:hypothetical protein
VSTQNTDVVSDESLTVDSAAETILGLLSDEEDGIEPTESQTPAAPAKKKVEETDEEVQPEDQETEQPEVEGEKEETDEPAEETEEAVEKLIFTVKLPDGTEEQVPADELTKGYLRTADYTRKTQALAEERKQTTAEKQRVMKIAQDYAAGLERIDAALAEPAEPDWDKLRTENPEEFPTRWAEWQQHEKRKEAVARERQRVALEIAEAQREQIIAHLEEERGKLLQAVPEWKDETVAKKEREEIKAFANSLGFTDDQVNSVTDHRLIVLLRKALKADKAEKIKPVVRKQIEKKTVVVKPGSGQTRKPVSDLTRSKQRLAQTGRIDDAAKAFEQMIDD